MEEAAEVTGETKPRQGYKAYTATSLHLKTKNMFWKNVTATEKRIFWHQPSVSKVLLAVHWSYRMIYRQ